MKNFMLPVDEQFIEQIAKAIGRDCLIRQAVEMLGASTEHKLAENSGIEERVDEEFEYLWNIESSAKSREIYHTYARAAINKINLLLLTTSR